VDLRDRLQIDVPLFAFSHCRDVVVAVSRAGGFGVLGASSHTPDQLEQQLAWIDAHIGGRPYGVDVVIPDTSGLPSGLDAATVLSLVPAEARDFADALLAAHDVDPASVDRMVFADITLNVFGSGAQELLDVCFAHPIALIANALGVPPASMVEAAAARGIPVAALVGSAEHAHKQVARGVEIIVAQGTEAGGHCGEVSTLCLVPEVVDAVGEGAAVLAAGGIVDGRQLAAVMALGAQGAWTGSVWLTTDEAETPEYVKQRLFSAGARDTVRSKARTGKPSRQLVSDWTTAWAAEGAPATLPLPVQSLVAEPALRRVDDLAAAGHEGARALATYWVGQGVGLMNRGGPAAEVVRRMAEDCADAVERLAGRLG
jgi:NAD(P)H-dependent flavin oxidoreductase YrpB (nitropropane dioxygenase family)